MSGLLVDRPAGRTPATDTSRSSADRGGGTGSRTHRAAARRRLAGPLTVVTLFVLAAALRCYRVATSYDLFIDEVTYRQIASNLAHGDGLTLYGDPFTLHPPSVFLVLAGAIRALGLDGPALADIDRLRLVSAVAGALLVPMTYALLRRVGAGWVAACAAALVIALDPFQISFDSRVMLEPYAQLFVLACLLALAASTRHPGAAGWALTVVAGAAGALAMTSKETFGLVLALTLGLVLVLGVVPRRRAAVAIALTVAGYVANAAVTAASYGFSTWWDYRIDGAARLIGTEQPTGFNSHTSEVTLTSRFLADLDILIVTYGLLVLGGIGSLVVLARHLRHLRRRPRPAAPVALIAPLWAFSACSYLAYATALGSIEEQMYYIPLVPCTMTLVLWARTWGREVPRAVLHGVVATALLAPLAYDAWVWHRVHTTEVDTYRQFMAWAPDHLDADARIATTDGITQFLLQRGVIGTWNTPAQLREQDVDYVLIQTKLVREGYGPGTLDLATWVQRKGTAIFSAAAGPDDELVVYDVRAVTGGSK